MQSKEKNNVIVIRLNSNEDFFKSLRIICEKHKIKNGVVLSGIGQLKNFCLGYYKKNSGYLTKKFMNPYELLHLSGNICKINTNNEFHIHAILSNEKMKTIGGHLLNAKVEITNEIIILKIGIDFSRIIENSSGLKKMALN